MYSKEKYDELVRKFGKIASWAIWNHNDPYDTKVIERNINQLNSKNVLIALNFSWDVPSNWPTWANFHDNTHARKLKYACNDTSLRGSYMTDLFKNFVKARSTNLNEDLTKEKIRTDVEFFRKEMEDVEIDESTQFILFGESTTSKFYNRYFRQFFRNKVITFYHYSYFTLTDKEWVEGFWKTVGIDHDYDLMIRKYKNR